MKPHFNSEQIMKLIADSMVRYKNKWAAAGMVLVLGAGSIGVSFLYHPAVKAAVPDEKIETEETMAASTAAASTEAETQSAWIPTLEELNLVHYFPEGGDETDITKSLAGHVFHELMTRDANWSSALYSLAFPGNAFLESIIRKTKAIRRKIPPHGRLEVFATCGFRR